MTEKLVGKENWKQKISGDVLIIYTGGTIGCAHKDPKDPESPLDVVSWERFSSEVMVLQEMQKKMKIEGFELDPPLDSTNMAPENWQQIAKIIERHYKNFNGFVILHGTDTMIYTAAALSFMLENLQKPVILTGSQLPIIGYTRNDGVQNLVSALEVANGADLGLPHVQEVCILFNDVLLRGNRARKISANGFKGFDSPNYPPLGTIGEKININPNLLLKRDANKIFNLNHHLNPNVVATLVFPGIQNSEIIQNIAKDQKLKGLVLLAYGTGSVPTDPKFLHAIEKARSEKKIVLNVTQSNQGTVELGVYETSAVLLEREVVSGSDITPEAALCKLMSVMGDEDLNDEDIMELVQIDLAGEQSRSVYSFNISDDYAQLSSNEPRWRRSLKNVGSKWPDNHLSKVAIRMYGVSLLADSKKQGTLQLSCFIGIRSSDALDYQSISCAGIYDRSIENLSSMVILDITESFKKRVRHNESTSFTIFLENANEGYALRWKKAELAIFTNSV